MNTNVWLEPGGAYLEEMLRQEARKWHLVHQPPASLEAWQEYRGELKQKLHALVGSFPEPVPLDVREHGTLEQDEYRIVKLTYQSREDLRVTANLYVPDGDGPFPGVLNVHGHAPQGKIQPRIAARGHTLAKEGFVVLAVDAFGAGERGTNPGEFEYHGKQLGSSLMSIGETLLGMQVYDNLRGIDLLCGLEYVDADRIGVTGASGGGNQTMWIAAFDERVKAAVPVVSVGTFESYVTNPNCICEVFPFGLTFMEEWAVLALMAPNALLLLNSLQDGPTFCVQEMIRSFNAAREVYRLYGIEEKIAYKAIDLPHGYHPEMRSHMLGWFRYWLKGEGSGLHCAIPEVPELPEPDLMCFPGTSRPAEIKSIVNYATIVGRRQKAALLDQKAALDGNEKRAALKQLLRIPDGSPRAERGPVVTEDAGDCVVEKFTVESDGILLPGAQLRPKSDANGTTVIAVHPADKSVLAEKQCIQALLAEGTTVCLADLRNIGETRWNESRIHADHDASRSALWLGRTMIGEWATDLLAIRAALAAASPATQFELLAFGEPGLAALAVVALSDAFGRASLSGLLATYVLDDEIPAYSMSAFVPSILKWGDVSLMAALAKCPLSIHGLVRPAGGSLNTQEQAAWRDEVQAFAETLEPGAQVDVVSDGLE